jgi:hypothetical protein
MNTDIVALRACNRLIGCEGLRGGEDEGAVARLRVTTLRTSEGFGELHTTLLCYTCAGASPVIPHLYAIALLTREGCVEGAHFGFNRAHRLIGGDACHKAYNARRVVGVLAEWGATFVKGGDAGAIEHICGLGVGEGLKAEGEIKVSGDHALKIFSVNVNIGTLSTGSTKRHLIETLKGLKVAESVAVGLKAHCVAPKLTERGVGGLKGERVVGALGEAHEGFHHQQSGGDGAVLHK